MPKSGRPSYITLIHITTWQYLGVIHIYFYCISTYTSHQKHKIIPLETVKMMAHAKGQASIGRVAKFQRFAGDMAPSLWIQLWVSHIFGEPNCHMQTKALILLLYTITIRSILSLVKIQINNCTISRTVIYIM